MSEEYSRANIINTLILGGVLATLIGTVANIYLAFVNLDTQKKIENHRSALEFASKKQEIFMQAKKELLYQIDYMPALIAFSKDSTDEASQLIGDTFKRHEKQREFIATYKSWFNKQAYMKMKNLESKIDEDAKMFGNFVVKGLGFKKPIFKDKPTDKSKAMDSVTNAFSLAFEYHELFEETLNEELKNIESILLGEYLPNKAN